jgi:hypothetical protein
MDDGAEKLGRDAVGEVRADGDQRLDAQDKDQQGRHDRAATNT